MDVVVDPVGGDRFTDSLRSLAREGRLVVLGFTGREIPTVKVNRLLLTNTTVMGAASKEFWQTEPGYVGPEGCSSASANRRHPGELSEISCRHADASH